MTQTIMNNVSFRRYKNRADAEEVKSILEYEDPEDHYSVVETDDGRFLVAIYDAEGYFVNYAP